MSRPVPPRPPAGPGAPVAGRPGPVAWGAGATTTVGVGRNDLVSGEAVALALPPANLGYRILSGIIDVLLGFGLWLFLWWLSFKVAGEASEELRRSMPIAADRLIAPYRRVGL